MKEKTVIVYTISWCRGCSKLKNHLKKYDINYIEKNVERDISANNEMVEKTKGKFMAYPIVDIDGEIILGSDVEKINLALGL